MGTSVSQASPQTSNWRVVAATYTSDAIPIDRVVQEIWRAATNQPVGNLAIDLGTPIVAQCLNIAQHATSREEAVRDARRSVAFSGQASLAADIAQRAVVQCFESIGDQAAAFTQSLFAEAGNYLVSRDLSGYVGVGGRAQTVSEAIALKNSLREQIVRTVSSVPLPSDVAREASIWRRYVEEVIIHLTGRS